MEYIIKIDAKIKHFPYIFEKLGRISFSTPFLLSCELSQISLFFISIIQSIRIQHKHGYVITTYTTTCFYIIKRIYDRFFYQLFIRCVTEKAFTSRKYFSTVAMLFSSFIKCSLNFSIVFSFMIRLFIITFLRVVFTLILPEKIEI